MTAPRLAVVLAAPFPAPRGSQRLVHGQVRALETAGAEAVLFSHGAGDGRDPGLRHWVRTPSRMASASLRSGFQVGKPLSDLALGLQLLREHRRAPFDAVIAHNAEAGLVALAARSLGGAPVVYLAHTLWQDELASYLPQTLGRWGARRGRDLDRLLARRCDACVVLGPAAEHALSAVTREPVVCIPPGHECVEPPDDQVIAEACRAHGLEPGGFVLYPGNLDRYQNLSLLTGAAEGFRDAPVVAVTQDPPRDELAGLRVVRVGSPEEARALIFGSGLVVVPRRAEGGFPIKLLEAMEARRAILALEAGAGTLVHGESAWIVPASVDGRGLAAAMRGLWREPELRARLGRGAGQQLAAVHGWPAHAEALLALVAKATGAQSDPERSRTISCT